MTIAYVRWLFLPAIIVILIFTGPVSALAATWESLYRDGELALLRKDFGAAQQSFGTALRIAERFAVDDPRLGKTLNSLAAVYYAQGEFEHAVPLLRRSLAVMELALGPDDPDVAQSMKNLAAVYYLQRNFADAEPLFQRALRIWENALGPEHPYIATLLSHMAGLYQAQGRYDDAKPLLVRSLTIWETLLGPEHPNVTQSRRLLAELGGTDAPAKPAAPVQVAKAAADDGPADAAAAPSAAKRLDLTNPADADTGAQPNPAAPARTAAETDVSAQSETAQSETAQSETAQSETARPETARPETARPETARPETARPATKLRLSGIGETKSKALGRRRSPKRSAGTSVLAAAAPVLAVRKASKDVAPASAKPEPEAAQQPALSIGGKSIAIFLASFRSTQEAERDWTRLQGRFPGLLGERTLEVETATLNSSGTFYRILTGPFEDRDSAWQLCRQLKAERQFCRVVRR